jgi:hypothetical protein
MAIMTSGFDEVDDPFQTPIRRHADPPIRFATGDPF